MIINMSGQYILVKMGDTGGGKKQMYEGSTIPKEDISDDPGPMRWPETVNNLVFALVFGLLCGIYQTYHTGGDLQEGGQVSAYASFFFIAFVSIHWVVVNVTWEIRLRKKRGVVPEDR